MIFLTRNEMNIVLYFFTSENFKNLVVIIFHVIFCHLTLLWNAI